MLKARFMAIAAIAGLALAGCSATPSDSGTAPTEDQTVRIVGIGSLDFSAIDIAKWQQNLEADGWNVDLKFVEDEDAALRAVIADAADIYIGYPGSMITAVQNTDAPMKLIAVNAPATDYVIVAKDEIKSIDDLAGRNIGVNTPGSAGDTIMRLALDNEGFDVDTAVYPVIGGTSARVAALQAGQIDATVSHVSNAEALVATGLGFHVLLSCGPSIGPYIQTGIMSSDKWLDAHPDGAVNLVGALIEAERWANTSKDEYIELSQDYDTETSDEVRDAAYDQFVDIGFFGVNGGISDGEVENWVKVVKDVGDFGDDMPDASKWFDSSYVEKYLETAGKV